MSNFITLSRNANGETRLLEEAEPSEAAGKGYNKRTKVVFQWIDAQGEPWWMQHPKPPTAGPSTLPKNEPELTTLPPIPRKLHQVPLREYVWAPAF